MMWASSFILLVIAVSSVCAAKLPLPSYLKACRKSDPKFDECVMKSAQDGLPGILKGDRKYGIPSFYPLALSNIKLQTAGNLVIDLKDVKIHGLEKAVLQKFKIDVEGKKIFLDFSTDVLNILGQYEMDGKILVLPLKGKGDANITATDCNFAYTSTYKIERRDGDEFVALDQQNLEFDVSRLYMRFENLFNDQKISDETNKIMNDEWKSILAEMNPAIAQTVSAVASSIVDKIAEKVPYKYLIPM